MTLLLFYSICFISRLQFLNITYVVEYLEAAQAEVYITVVTMHDTVAMLYMVRTQGPSMKATDSILCS